MADTRILDAYGRPFGPTSLKKKRMATATTTGVRASRRAVVTDGLTPQRLAAIIRQIDDGDARAYLELAEEMEEREPHYASVLYTRKLAVSALPLGCKPASDDDADEKLAAEVLAAFEEAGGSDLVEDMLDAIGKGFSAIELAWDTSTTPWKPRAGYVDPRWFHFKGTGRREDLRLRDDADPQEGIELPPGRFMTHFFKRKSGHPIRSGLARLAAVSYMIKAYTLKDWLAFAEVYGMPLRIGKYPSGIDESTPDGAADMAALVDAVANLGSDAAAVIPESMMIEFVQSQRSGGSGGEAVYQGLCTYVDKQVSKAALGQTMTTDEGSSLSQSKTHDGVRQDYRDADARRVMKSANRDFTRVYVDVNYGKPANGYPVLYLDVSEPEDLVSLSTALVPLVDRGLPVPEVWVRGKFGIPDLDGDGGGLALHPLDKGAAAPGEDGDGAPDEPDDEKDDDEVKKAKASRRRARVAFAAARKPRKADALDALAEAALAELDTNPFLGPVRALAAGSNDYADFIQQLPGVLEQMDVSAVGDELAVAMFNARGLGDATDSLA